MGTGRGGWFGRSSQPPMKQPMNHPPWIESAMFRAGRCSVAEIGWSGHGGESAGCCGPGSVGGAGLCASDGRTPGPTRFATICGRVVRAAVWLAAARFRFVWPGLAERADGDQTGWRRVAQTAETLP